MSLTLTLKMSDGLLVQSHTVHDLLNPILYSEKGVNSSLQGL